MKYFLIWMLGYPSIEMLDTLFLIKIRKLSKEEVTKTISNSAITEIIIWLGIGILIYVKI